MNGILSNCRWNSVQSIHIKLKMKNKNKESNTTECLLRSHTTTDCVIHFAWKLNVNHKIAKRYRKSLCEMHALQSTWAILTPRSGQSSTKRILAKSNNDFAFLLRAPLFYLTTYFFILCFALHCRSNVYCCAYYGILCTFRANVCVCVLAGWLLGDKCVDWAHFQWVHNSESCIETCAASAWPPFFRPCCCCCQ